MSGCDDQRCGEQGCSGSAAAAEPAARPAAATAAPAPGATCMKCCAAEAELVARGREPLCYPCLYEQLLSKVRNAVRLHSLILPGDAVGLAFSGGRASAALLRFLSDLRTPVADRPARGKVSFTMHIIHVDESAAALHGPESDGAAAAGSEAVAAAAQPYLCPGVQYHRVTLEDVFGGADGGEGAAQGPPGTDEGGAGAGPARRERLRALLAAVSDPTGRDDLVRHLRSGLLLRTAAALGCARLALGDCATALATHIVAAASKGCGYSLAGDVRLLDARHGDRLPAVLRPLRDVSLRELALVCSHWGLPLAPAGGAADAPTRRAAKKNINALAAAFIGGMEAHNPGSVPNILNTIAKLEAFPWNEPQPQQAGQHPGRQQQQQQRQRRQRQQDGGRQACVGSAPPAVLCPICLAPLADDELPGGGSASEHTSGGSGVAARAAAAACCISCFCQVLGGGVGAPAAVGGQDDVIRALPVHVQRQMAALAASYSHAAAAQGDGGDGGPDLCHSGDSSSIGRLRAQVAEFLLDC